MWQSVITETENMDSFMLNHKYDAILDSLNYTDVNLMNQQSDDLMNKTLDSKCPWVFGLVKITNLNYWQ